MNVQGKAYRTVWMDNNIVYLINQPKLPHHFEILPHHDTESVALAIETMVVRGAGAIGATGAFGLAQAAQLAPTDTFWDDVNAAKHRLAHTRPTAQNLFYGLKKVYTAITSATTITEARTKALLAAQSVADEDAEACRQIGIHGAERISKGMRISTHCNAGWLAFVDWGSAISPVYVAHRQGKKPFVFVDETKPRGQGARLTAWELAGEGVDHAVIADNATGFYMAHGDIDMVIVGSDRIAANGDVANKIGTYTSALAAHANGIPFYVAAPLATVDWDCASGQDIPIEERSADEVHYTWGWSDNGDFIRVRTTPQQSDARNPAFDVTPAKYITGIITERGIVKPGQLSQFRP